jgi:hypothetical protein
MKVKPIEKETSIKKDGIDYPVFCFKYLQDVSIRNCTDHRFFHEFLFRMKKLCQLGWSEINRSQRHAFGTEQIPVSSLRPESLPPIITKDIKKLTVFRANGNNLPFLGVRAGNIFHVIFIETRFGDVYNH